MAAKKTESKTATKKPAAKKTPAKKPVAKANNKSQEAASANFPMFYKSISVLNKDAHSDLKITPPKNFNFAKEANSIIVMASEFAQAAMHYPIVFGQIGEDTVSFAVTGHIEGANNFVDSKGKWRAETYIPAYVRRYPFILVQSQDHKQLSLAIDESADVVVKRGGEALYDKGEPTDTAKRALQFCASFRKEMERTAALMKQINETGILIERTAEVTTAKDGEKQRIVGFSIVDEKALMELADDKFLELRKTGALNLIYCHLWSMRVWNNLLDE